MEPQYAWAFRHAVTQMALIKALHLFRGLALGRDNTRGTVPTPKQTGRTIVALVVRRLAAGFVRQHTVRQQIPLRCYVWASDCVAGGEAGIYSDGTTPRCACDSSTNLWGQARNPAAEPCMGYLRICEELAAMSGADFQRVAAVLAAFAEEFAAQEPEAFEFLAPIIVLQLSEAPLEGESSRVQGVVSSRSACSLRRPSRRGRRWR